MHLISQSKSAAVASLLLVIFAFTFSKVMIAEEQPNAIPSAAIIDSDYLPVSGDIYLHKAKSDNEQAFLFDASTNRFIDFALLDSEFEHPRPIIISPLEHNLFAVQVEFTRKNQTLRLWGIASRKGEWIIKPEFIQLPIMQDELF